MTNITAAQCRAGRALVGLSQVELAEKAGVSKKTVEMYELDKVEPRGVTLDKLRKSLEKAGVVFIDSNGEGPGVRLKRPRR